MQNNIESSVKTALITLVVIYVLNQFTLTRPLTQRALNGF
jgi:hypothetical protein